MNAEQSADPVAALERWLTEARMAEPAWSNAMVLATASAGGRPSARAVVLRSLDDDGLGFLTDTDSRKGRELGANPFAAAVLLCAALRRQVVVDGSVVMLEEVDSDAMFAARPPGAQLPLWAWRQDEIIDHAAVLVQRLEQARTEHDGAEPGRPPYWAGYRLRPKSVEFWEERAGGLHERIRYQRVGAAWQVQRLAP